MSEDMSEYTIPYYITSKAEFDVDAPDYSEEFALALIMRGLENGNKKFGRVMVGEPEITFDFGNLRRGMYDHDWIDVYIKQKVRSKKTLIKRGNQSDAH